mgnify:CR=1 FL=1
MITVMTALFAVGSAIPLFFWIALDRVLPALPFWLLTAVLACFLVLGRRHPAILAGLLSCLAGYVLTRSAVEETQLDYTWCQAVSGSQQEIVLKARVYDLSGLFAVSPSIVVAVVDPDLLEDADGLQRREPRLIAYLSQHTFGTDSVSGCSFLEGDIVEIRGKIQPVLGPKFFGGVNPRAVYLPRRIVGVMSNCTIQGVYMDGQGESQPWSRLMRLVSSVRISIARAVVATLPQAEAGIVLSAFLGLSGTLPDQVDDAIRNSGIAHLLSVSGMHVSMVAAGVAVLLRVFTGQPRKVRFVALPIVCLYALLSGAKVPVIRALLMFALASLSSARAFGWSPRKMTELAALVILAIDPLQLAQASFQLSFGATYGIIVASTLSAGTGSAACAGRSLLSSVLNRIKGIVVTSLGAHIGVGPFLAFHFRNLSLVGGPATVLASPLLVLGTISTIAGVAADAIGLGAVATAFIGIGKRVLGLLVLCATVLGNMKYSSPDFSNAVSRAVAVVLASFWVLLLSVRRDNLTRRPRVNRWAVIAAGVISCTAVLFVGLAEMASNSRLEMYFLSVGQGDCIVCVTPGGRTIIVDAGPSFQRDGYVYDAGESVLIPFLKWRGISHVDLFILTHCHNDHFGGLPALVDRDMVSVICCTEPERLVHLLGSTGVRCPGTELDAMLDCSNRPAVFGGLGPLLVQIKAGDILRVGDVRVAVLWPPNQIERVVPAENARSIVALVTYRKFNALLTGDIGSEEEVKIINALRRGVRTVIVPETGGQPLLSSRLDVLKVAHHGSEQSSSYVFLRSLLPRMAVISTGANRHGHPSPETICRLQRYSEIVTRTDEHGSIRLSSDGKYMSADTSRGRCLARQVLLE